MGSLQAGNDATLVAGGDVLNESRSSLTAGRHVTLNVSPDGKLILDAAKDVDASSYESSRKGMIWRSSEQRGSVQEAVLMTLLKAGDGFTINAPGGKSVTYREDGDLRHSLEQLSKLPGLEYLKQLQNDPRVDWKALQEAHRQWSQSQQGLSGPAAALIALAIAICTYGSASALAANIAAATGGGIVGSSVGAAAAAALTALGIQINLSLINNLGDIGKVFRDVTSSQSLRSLAIAALTAGLTEGLTSAMGITVPPAGAGFDTKLIAAAQRSAIDAAVNTGVQTLIEGRPLGESLVSSLRTAAGQLLGSTLAAQIGDAAHAGDINKAVQYVAHGALGCGVALVSGGDAGACASGAMGAVIGEAAGQLYRSATEEKLERQLAEATRNGVSQEELARQIAEWRRDGVDLARLSAGLAAVLSGLDVNQSANAAGIAALNNALAGESVSRNQRGEAKGKQEQESLKRVETIKRTVRGVAANAKKGWSEEERKDVDIYIDDLVYTANVESSLGTDGKAYDKNNGTQGLFQFTRGTFKDYAKKAGIENPDIMNDEHSTMAALELYRENRKLLQRNGIDKPDRAQLYALHQQGSAGGLAIVKASLSDTGKNNTVFGIIKGYFETEQAAKNAIDGNIPKDKKGKGYKVEDITAGEFMRILHEQLYPPDRP